MPKKTTEKFKIENTKTQRRILSKKKDSGHYKEAPAEKRFQTFSIVLFWICLILWVGTLVYIAFFSNFLMIKSVRISGARSLSEDELSREINQQFSGKYLSFLPKNNFLFATKSRIEKTLSKKFKKIKTVSTEKTFPSKIEISITERETSLIWCSQNFCYYLDKDGHAWSGVDFNSPEFTQNEFIIITDKSGQLIDQEKQILESSYINFILNLREKLFSEADIQIERDVTTPSVISKTVELKTKEGWTIFSSLEWSAENQAQALKNVLDKKIEDQRTDLEYVDLRIKNKVFYRFKNNEEDDSDEKKDGEDKDDGNGDSEKEN